MTNRSRRNQRGSAQLVLECQSLGKRRRDIGHAVCRSGRRGGPAPAGLEDTEDETDADRLGLAGRAAGEGRGVIRPCLRRCRLQAAEAAQDWMAGQHHRTPSARPGAICHHRVVRPRRRHPRRVPPGLGLSRRGDRDDLPSLRSDDADRLVGRDRPVTWRWPSCTWWPRAPGLSTGSRPPPSRAGQGARHCGGQTVAAAGCHRGAAAHAVLTPKALTGKLGIAPRRPCCGSCSRMER